MPFPWLAPNIFAAKQALRPARGEDVRRLLRTPIKKAHEPAVPKKPSVESRVIITRYGQLIYDAIVPVSSVPKVVCDLVSGNGHAALEVSIAPR